ncbi:leucine-rich repeat domain-containing protein [Mesotoga sp.]|uniref:leucine-rich repeat domain-containing protein n=1 Tax=Mesotoga sp. TaxID=2053577 RepID=UPI00345E1869
MRHGRGVRTVNLEELWLQNTGLVDLSFLTGMESLSTLRVNSNSITDVSCLLNLNNLKQLYIYNNPTGHIDIVLKNMAPFEGLGIDMSQLHNFETIGELGQLFRLEIEGVHSERLQDIEFVNDFHNLKDLGQLCLYFHEIEDTSPLSVLVNLKELAIFSSLVVSIESIKDLEELTYLYLSNNRIEDISPVQALTNLRWLVIDHNEIDNISPLVANPGISSGDYVNMSNNYLDLTPGSQNMNDIQALLDRGVSVVYEPQREPGESAAAYVHCCKEQYSFWLEEQVYWCGMYPLEHRSMFQQIFLDKIDAGIDDER